MVKWPLRLASSNAMTNMETGRSSKVTTLETDDNHSRSFISNAVDVDGRFQRRESIILGHSGGEGHHLRQLIPFEKSIMM